MTVGELRKLLDGVPDDREVTLVDKRVIFADEDHFLIEKDYFWRLFTAIAVSVALWTLWTKF